MDKKGKEVDLLHIQQLFQIWNVPTGTFIGTLEHLWNQNIVFQTPNARRQVYLERVDVRILEREPQTAAVWSLAAHFHHGVDVIFCGMALRDEVGKFGDCKKMFQNFVNCEIRNEFLSTTVRNDLAMWLSQNAGTHGQMHVMCMSFAVMCLEHWNNLERFLEQVLPQS